MNRIRNAGIIAASLLGAGLVTLPMGVRGGGHAGGGGGDECSDRVTGGGWIITDGATANFGVEGGILKGKLWGHLNYVKEEADLHIVSTAVTFYEGDLADSDCRFIKYDVEVNGEPGFTAEVHLCD